jgi:hypothetical protein
MVGVRVLIFGWGEFQDTTKSSKFQILEKLFCSDLTRFTQIQNLFETRSKEFRGTV